MKKGMILTGTACGEQSKIELLSNVTKRGRATVRILEAGIIEAKVGHVIKSFEVTHGCIKFSE